MSILVASFFGETEEAFSTTIYRVSKIVFILGAGASAHAGAPMMAGFLDRARDIFAPSPGPEWEDHFRTVFRAISSLQQVHSKSDLNLNNLESLFTTFEMAQTIKKLPGFQADEIPALIDSFKKMIVRTLDLSMQFPVTKTLYEGSQGTVPARMSSSPRSGPKFGQIRADSKPICDMLPQ